MTQGAQTRSYVYDALGRLNSSTTPEAGTVCLGTLSGTTCQSNGYDSFDNLLYRTDARGVVTNYIYDTLNRLVGVSYPTVPGGVAAMPNFCATTGSSSNNANVCFAYGTTAASLNNGRPVSMTDPSGSESYTYDQFGNVTQLAKVIGATTYTTGYAYNLANQLTSITYPSNRVVQQNVDTIGRLSSVVGTLGSVNTTYANNFLYSPAQQVTGFNYGNNINAAFGYSADRLQLNCLDYSATNRNGACAHDATTKFGLNYAYGTSGTNNGQIGGITDSVDSGRSATYTYDALYRLTAAATTGSTTSLAWGLSEVYDRYGNRSAQNVTAGTGPSNSVTIDANTNRLIGAPYAYDLSGNMTNDGNNTLVYDGENRATSATNGGSSGAYTYDGNGLRVKKCLPNCTSPASSTVYIFSGSKVISEYDNGAAPASPSREYIYSGGRLLAKIDYSGTKYYHQDHLSNRLVTDSAGNALAQMGHYPFGESWYNASTDKLLFTTYERDAESGNDFALARYNINRLARFSSADPLSGTIAEPQSLNRYAYVLNSPVNLLDPLGLTVCDANGNNCYDSVTVYVGGFFGGGSGGGGGRGTWRVYEGPDRGAGGSGGGNSSGPHIASWQTGPMHYSACISKFYNSWVGKGVQFLAPTSLIPGWNPGAWTNVKNWAEAIVTKTALLNIAVAGSNAGQIVNYSVTAGTATVAASELSGVVAAGLAVVSKVALPVMATATAVDLVAHAGCALNAAVTVGFP